MATLKQVKNLLVLLLFYLQILHIKGVQTSNEPNAPEEHILYDQRQSGKYNIHVVIKDVAIIEMDQNELSDQNYSDDDYYYDEDDLTIKPLNIKTTTSSNKPLDSTGHNNTTNSATQTTIISSEQNLNVETTSKNPQDISSTATANIQTTSNKEFNNSVGDLMTFFTTTRPIVDIKSRSKIEPIYAIEQPVFRSRHHLQDFNYGIPAQSRDSKIFSDSRIFKVKVNHSHRTPQGAEKRERCRSYQYRDARGNCRGMRSSSGSILKRLFRMLVTLPFEQDGRQNDD